MKLSIVIPCNQDTLQNQNLTAMFNSLNNQVHVDWEEIEVILVHPYAQYKFDMRNYSQLKSSFRAYYSKKTYYSEIKQFGLDIAQGEYVWFLMPNNILYNMTVIVDLMQILITKPSIDYFLFNVGNGYAIDQTTNDIGFNNSLIDLDGKVFKHEFLNINNIAFLENITSGEDLYFTQKIMNLYPQFSIENNALVLQIAPHLLSVPLEEQYLNNITALTTANTEYIIETTNKTLDKIVEILLQTYESLYSYGNDEYRNLIKLKLKTFVLGLQNLINLNVIFAKCMNVSNNYFNNDIVAANENQTFYDFIISIFIDEDQQNENNMLEEGAIKE